MKSARLLIHRVEPELRDALEEVMVEGETLSGFIDSSVRAEIDRRKARAAFLRRGLDALARFERTDESVAAEAVHRKPDARLARPGQRLAR